MKKTIWLIILNIISLSILGYLAYKNNIIKINTSNNEIKRKSTNRKYEDYNNLFVDYSNAFEQDWKTTYYLYLYTPTCSACDNIKESLFDTLDNKDMIWHILLFDVSDCIDKLTETKDGENIWNVNYIKTIEELRIAGRPCLISVSKTNDIFKVYLEAKGAAECETWFKNVIKK